jgi:hypothetical protein
MIAPNHERIVRECARNTMTQIKRMSDGPRDLGEGCRDTLQPLKMGMLAQLIMW